MNSFISIFSAFFILLGLLVWRFPKLIAGYNTMTSEQQKKVDVKGLKAFMCRVFCAIGVLVFVSYLLLRLFMDEASAINISSIVVPIIGVIYLLAGQLTGCLSDNLLHHLHVGREPRHAVQLFQSQPGGTLMLFQHQTAGNDRTAVAMHREVEQRILAVYRGEEGIHPDVGVQFLADFTHQGLFPALARLYLSTGKFPIVFELAIAALGGEVLSVAHHHRCHYLDVFLYFTALSFPTDAPERDGLGVGKLFHPPG